MKRIILPILLALSLACFTGAFLQGCSDDDDGPATDAAVEASVQVEAGAEASVDQGADVVTVDAGAGEAVLEQGTVDSVPTE